MTKVVKWAFVSYTYMIFTAWYTAKMSQHLLTNFAYSVQIWRIIKSINIDSDMEKCLITLHALNQRFPIHMVATGHVWLLVLVIYRAFHWFGQAKYFRLVPIFNTAPAVSKNNAWFKSGQNQPKSVQLPSFVNLNSSHTL